MSEMGLREVLRLSLDGLLSKECDDLFPEAIVLEPGISREKERHPSKNKAVKVVAAKQKKPIKILKVQLASLCLLNLRSISAYLSYLLD